MQQKPNDFMSQLFAKRIQILKEYNTYPLSDLEDAVGMLSCRVAEHLKTMEVAWK